MCGCMTIYILCYSIGTQYITIKGHWQYFPAWLGMGAIAYTIVKRWIKECEKNY